MSKRLRLVQRMKFLQIATKEDSRILKTKQNVFFRICTDALFPCGAEKKLVILVKQF